MNDPTAEPAETEPTTPAEKPDPKEAMSQLREFLGGLEPEDEIVLLDTEGREHRVRTTLPARRHIRALRLLDDLVEKAGELEDEAGQGLIVKRSGMRRIVAGLRRAIHSDELVDKVGEVFATAYPALVAPGEEGGSPLDPLEVFPLEAILEGLLPLLSRLLAKALATAEKAEKKSQTGTTSGT